MEKRLWYLQMLIFLSDTFWQWEGHSFANVNTTNSMQVYVDWIEFSWESSQSLPKVIFLNEIDWLPVWKKKQHDRDVVKSLHSHKINHQNWKDWLILVLSFLICEYVNELVKATCALYE
jgi:hypothetical protein